MSERHGIVDLRTERPECIQLGQRFPWFHTKGWTINGHEDCWVVYATVDGWNGGGGYWITEEWTWRSNGQTCRSHIRTLNREDSESLERAWRDGPHKPEAES